MKVFITKYALSGGILELESVEPPTDDMVRVFLPHASFPANFSGKDWYSTLEAAVERAEAMRAAEIVRLEKKIATLRRKSFAKS